MFLVKYYRTMKDDPLEIFERQTPWYSRVKRRKIETAKTAQRSIMDMSLTARVYR